MKIAVSASQPQLDAPIDPRFGRCPYFLIVDSDTMEFEVIENQGAMAGSGAGIQAAQLVANAGAEAVVRFIEGLAESPDRYPHVAFDIIPVVNPWGWAHDRRRNQQGLDINRDFASFDAQEARLIRDFVRKERYDLVVDHHEHPGGRGFYLYQIDCDETALSRRVIAHQRERGYPIEQDVRMVIFKTRDGLIRIPGWGLPLAKLGRMLSMTNYLRMQGNPRVFLIETPTTASWDDRTAMHGEALELLLAESPTGLIAHPS